MNKRIIIIDDEPNAVNLLEMLIRQTTPWQLLAKCYDALEAIAFQTCDVIDAIEADSGVTLTELRVDSGAAAYDLLLQIQADLLGRDGVRPAMLETTALGAAFLAGIATGVWDGLDSVATTWKQRDCFQPSMPEDQRRRLVAGWRSAVERTLST